MKLYYAVLTSILVHLLLYIFAKEIASHFDTPISESEVEVVILEGDNLRVVRNPTVPEPDSLDPSNTNLLSERNQQFKKQQRAKVIDQTVNRSNQKAQEQAQKEFVEKLKAINALSEQIIKNLKKKNEQLGRPTPSNPNLFEPSSEPSTVNDPFTNVPLGSFTALNTNRYLYYSYYARIEDQIRHRWVRKIRDVIDSRPPIRFSDRNKDVWSTEVEILLDKKGHFVRADVHRSAGLTKFDYAAMDAFREGAPILNPPQGMVGDDGYIHIKYGFNVFWKPNFRRR